MMWIRIHGNHISSDNISADVPLPKNRSPKNRLQRQIQNMTASINHCNLVNVSVLYIHLNVNNLFKIRLKIPLMFFRLLNSGKIH